MQADIIRGMLNSDMSMFGRTHGKLRRISDYIHPMEWMTDYDGHRGSCTV